MGPLCLHVLLQGGESGLSSGQIAALQGCGKGRKVLGHWALLTALRSLLGRLRAILGLQGRKSGLCARQVARLQGAGKGFEGLHTLATDTLRVGLIRLGGRRDAR